MRTTLTLDDDVAALLRKAQAQRKASLKEVVNDALRRGLAEKPGSVKSRVSYRTPSVNLGRCLVGSLDDIAEVLAVSEGESFR